MNLVFFCVMQMAGSKFEANRTNSWTFPAKWQIFRLIVAFGSGNILPEYTTYFDIFYKALNSAAYLNIVICHVHPCMAIIFSYGDGHFKQCHPALSVFNLFEEHQSEFNLLPYPAQSYWSFVWLSRKCTSNLWKVTMQYYTTYRCHYVIMSQHSSTMVSGTCFVHAKKIIGYDHS